MKFNFNGITKVIGRATGRSGLLLKKHSPEILMVVGVAGVVTSAVMACRATLKAEKVIDRAKWKIDAVHKVKEGIDNGEVRTAEGKKYTQQDYQKDLAVAYIQSGFDFLKLYGPSVLVGVASISCLVGSHGIMRKRNLGLIAAYKAVEESFREYRKRVVDELGEDKDRQFRYGVSKIEKITTNEDGSTTGETVEVFDSIDASQYSRVFNESFSEWNRDTGYNCMFLKCQENMANDLLQSRGHVFLHEVYDMLGIPRTPASIVVGWVKGVGDDYVDFGIFETGTGKLKDFVDEHNILLDFNVAGVVFDLI